MTHHRLQIPGHAAGIVLDSGLLRERMKSGNDDENTAWHASYAAGFTKTTSVNLPCGGWGTRTGSRQILVIPNVQMRVLSPVDRESGT